MSTYPAIIQGGMGAGVSAWRLARAVSRLGQLGVKPLKAKDVPAHLAAIEVVEIGGVIEGEAEELQPSLLPQTRAAE